MVLFNAGMNLMPSPTPYLFNGLLLLTTLISAFEVSPYLSTAIDYSQLGDFVVTGNYATLSPYTQQIVSSSNIGDEPQTLSKQLPNGSFVQLETFNGYINGICSFTTENPSFTGLFLGGVFNWNSAPNGVATLWSLDQTQVNPMVVSGGPNVSQDVVYAVLFEAKSQTLYVGGSFGWPGSSNLLTWTENAGWAKSSFGGFNGSVKSMVQIPDGSIIFGGQLNGTSGYPLNGLYIFDPAEPDMEVATSRLYIIEGLSLDHGASVNAMVTVGNLTFVGGNFTGSELNNIFSIDSGQEQLQAIGLPFGGLNGEVSAMLLDKTNDDTLYIGGFFNDTTNSTMSGLNHIAAYLTVENLWQSLGCGVNGPVTALNFISVNVTENIPENAILVFGDFDQLLPCGGWDGISVDNGMGIWLPLEQTWLANLNSPQLLYQGYMSTSVLDHSGQRYYGGYLNAYGIRANGVAMLSNNSVSGGPGLYSYELNPANFASVNTGLLLSRPGQNTLVLGGQFLASLLSDDSLLYNLMFIDESSGTTTGLPYAPVMDGSEKILALGTYGEMLYAGGDILIYDAIHKSSDDVLYRGLVVWDMQNNAYASPSPDPLDGPNVVVNAIAIRPGTAEVYVGGSFEKAGNLACPSVCICNQNSSQWTRPGDNFNGTVNLMTWANADTLIVAGDLKVDNIPLYMATYYAPNNEWTPFNLDNPLSGPVTAMTPSGDSNAAQTWVSDSVGLWVAGMSKMGVAYLVKWNGSSWLSVDNVFGTGAQITSLKIIPVVEPHSSTVFLNSSVALMVAGTFQFPDLGNASVILFDGITFELYLDTNTRSGDIGTVTSIITLTLPAILNVVPLEGNVIWIALIVIGVLLFILFIGEAAEEFRRRPRGYARVLSKPPKKEISPRLRDALERQGTDIQLQQVRENYRSRIRSAHSPSRTIPSDHERIVTVPKHRYA
ncbi:MAG: hypothetical protein MMC33_004527 [Icmadophila ericetorum]|nr:hypothetical protein [Icmadophila ericetorum]